MLMNVLFKFENQNIQNTYVNTIKNTTGSSATQIVVDRGISRAVSHNIQTARFGDGYSQRVRAGINSKNDSFNIALNNRSAEDIALVSGFSKDMFKNIMNNVITTQYDVMRNTIDNPRYDRIMS